MITSTEKEAIKQYCLLQCEIDDAKQERRHAHTTSRRNALSAKEQVDAHMKRINAECIQIDDTTFARRKTCQSLRAVSQAMVHDAIATVIDESPDDEDVTSRLIDAIQDQRATYREFVELTTTRPKKIKTTVVPADPDMVQSCQAWKDELQKIKEQKRAQKAQIDTFLQTQRQYQPHVEAFMQRSALTSQKVNVKHNDEMATYFVRNKVSKSRPRITKPLIATSVASVGWDGHRGTLKTDATRIGEAIFSYLNTRPPKSSKKVLTLIRKKGSSSSTH